MREDLNKNNTFYKRRIEELGERLQEQNDLIITQKKQVCFVKQAVSENTGNRETFSCIIFICTV